MDIKVTNLFQVTEEGSYRDGYHLGNERARSEMWPPDMFAVHEAKTLSPTGGQGGKGGGMCLRRMSTRDSESVFQQAQLMQWEHRGLSPVMGLPSLISREDI